MIVLGRNEVLIRRSELLAELPDYVASAIRLSHEPLVPVADVRQALQPFHVCGAVKRILCELSDAEELAHQ